MKCSYKNGKVKITTKTICHFKGGKKNHVVGPDDLG